MHRAEQHTQQRIADLVDDWAYRLSVGAHTQCQYAKQSDPDSAGNPETIHFHNDLPENQIAWACIVSVPV